MCYKVHTHTLPCDVRPTISSSQTVYLDPYETPPHCPCPRPSSSRSKRCPSHGCCRLSSILYRCPRDCRRPLNYHIYIRSSDSPRRSYSSDSNHRRSYSAHPRSSYRPPTPPSSSRWRALRIFDRDPDFQTRESGDLRFAISELRDIGRVLLHAESELEKAALRIERERQRHCGAHGGCEKLKPTKDCDWSARVAEMVSQADNLKFTMEVLAVCWVKYVGLLRNYEAMGQRRVGGLVEDPLSGRRRREEDEPRVYGRRESWVDGAGSGRERGRERERERKQERERERERGRQRDRDYERERRYRSSTREPLFERRGSFYGGEPRYRSSTREPLSERRGSFHGGERRRSWWDA